MARFPNGALMLALLLGVAVPAQAWTGHRRSRGLWLGGRAHSYQTYLPYWTAQDIWCQEQRYLEKRQQKRGAAPDPERAKRLGEECEPKQGTSGR